MEIVFTYALSVFMFFFDYEPDSQYAVFLGLVKGEKSENKDFNNAK